MTMTGRVIPMTVERTKQPSDQRVEASGKATYPLPQGWDEHQDGLSR